jgi:ketosteroid isomerase-like protein
MSRENVEVVRAVFAEWQKGNLRTAPPYDPLVLYVPGPWLPDTSRYYVGPEGVQEFTLGWLEGWTRLSVMAEEVIEAGDSVVVAVRQQGVGKESGTPTDLRFFEVWTFRGGLVTRREGFPDRSQAVEAVGLSEWPRQNVEIVRRVFEAAGRGDTQGILGLYDPDIEWDASRTERGAITGGVVRGHQAVLEWLREWYDPWETVDDDLEELIEATDNRVVSVMVQRGRGKASGVEVADRLGTVWTIRNGKVVRVVWFPSREAALEAAGISA